MQWLLIRLPRRVRCVLTNGELIFTGFRMIRIFHIQYRSSRLTVPAAELLQVCVVCVFHRQNKILAGYRTAIVTLKVEVASAAERLRAQNGVYHPHHFRAFFIHSQGIEIGDFHIGIRAYRM